MTFSRTVAAAVLLVVCCSSVPGVHTQWIDSENNHICQTKGECLGQNVTVEEQFGKVSTCQCSDLVPQVYAGGPTNGTCLENQILNNCEQPWMKTISSDDVGTEGYCQITCGRCSCCKNIKDVLTSLGATTLIAAAQAANLGSNLTNPGTYFTLLAPTNAAFDQAVAALGTTQAALFANTPLLTQILSYHILPLVPFLETAWTTPFFLPGTVLATSIPGRTIHVAPSAGPTATLVGGIGGSGTARVAAPDFEPCKGNVILIDSVLLPSATPVTAPPVVVTPPTQSNEAVQAATYASSDMLGVESAAAEKALNQDPAVIAAAKAASADLISRTGQQANSNNQQLSQQGAAAGR